MAGRVCEPRRTHDREVHLVCPFARCSGADGPSTAVPGASYENGRPRM